MRWYVFWLRNNKEAMDTRKTLSLQPIDTVRSIDAKNFRKAYFKTGKPLIIKELSKDWPAVSKWNWDYFKQMVGDKKVGIYNNNKSDPYTPVNVADAYTTFGEYIDMISKGPCEWRIFLFNLFQHAPQMAHDFSWPDHLLTGFVKRVPMLFVGGQGSITHMHFDMDLSHIVHTQFGGRKRVLLFPYQEKEKLYKKPFEVMSLVDFSYYHDAEKSKIDYEKFPMIAKAKGYEAVLHPGDTLFMPGGYWHHMEYIDSGFAVSLRAIQHTLGGKIRGAWNITGMRYIDTFLKKTASSTWCSWKERKVYANASQLL
jgi:hypothetical protein